MRVGTGLKVIVIATRRTCLVVTRHAWLKVAWGARCILPGATVVKLASRARALALWTVAITHWAVPVAVTTHMAVGTWGTGFAVAAFAARGWATAAATASTRTRSAFGVADALHHFVACGFGSGCHHVAAWRLAQTTPQGLTAHGNGFGFFIGLGTKTFDHHDWDLLFGEVLNVFHEAFFVQ